MIHKLLGQGACGKVYLVSLKTNPEKYYAMKRLKKEDLEINEGKNERDILINLKSPFVTNIRAAFQDEGHLYLVLEYASGKDLFTLLGNQTNYALDLEWARFYMAELVLALEALHKQNIVHRDLKLENILIDSEGHIKLTDFGMSKLLGDKGKAKTFCGTLNYIAPEIIFRKKYDKAVDWWSFGCVMFGILEGYFPFDIRKENIKKITENSFANIRFNKIRDESAKDLIRQLLTIDPKKRLGSGTDGINKIKKHAFFKKIDWDVAKNRRLNPPFIPPKEENIKKHNITIKKPEEDYDIDERFRDFSFYCKSDLEDSSGDGNGEKIIGKYNIEISYK